MDDAHTVTHSITSVDLLEKMTPFAAGVCKALPKPHAIRHLKPQKHDPGRQDGTVNLSFSLNGSLAAPMGQAHHQSCVFSMSIQHGFKTDSALVGLPPQAALIVWPLPLPECEVEVAELK